MSGADSPFFIFAHLRILQVPMAIVITHNPHETEALGAQLVTTLMQNQALRATSTIIALRGNLGAGKTVFVKGIAGALGVNEVITSPTYVIQKTYHTHAPVPWKRLIHIDAYRLQGEEELTTIGWDTFATDPKNLIVIEWPEQVGRGVPTQALDITINHIDESTREINMPYGDTEGSVE